MLSRSFVSVLAFVSVASAASPALSYDDRSLYPGYGTYSEPGNQETVRCESKDFSFERCPVRTGGEAYIVRQLSNTACQQGQNWGYDQRGIWVDKGCGAEFAVGRREARRYDGDRWSRGDQYGPGYGQSLTDQKTVRCESEGFEFTRCRVRTGGDVRIVRQLSEAQCRRGENWGFDRRGIWVDKGCAAEFSVAGTNTNPYYTDRR